METGDNTGKLDFLVSYLLFSLSKPCVYLIYLQNVKVK